MNIKPQKPNHDHKAEKSKSGKKKRIPKKITDTYLKNAGLYYLQRFPSSIYNFRRVMMRKVKDSCFYHKDQNPEDCAQMVEALIKNFKELGLLNDPLYAQAAITSMRRQGKSKRAIITNLGAKGVEETLITDILENYDQNENDSDLNAELHAALIFARKKKIGPFKGEKKVPEEKELGALARAGFSYETARSVLEFTPEEVQQYLRF